MMKRSLSLFAALCCAAVSIGTIGLDGHKAGIWVSGRTFTVTGLNTTINNDVLAAYIATESSSLVTVTSISAAGTTGWTKRKQSSFQGSNSVELWYGTASAPLAAVTVTITLSATPAGTNAAMADIFGISGANTSTINDPNASLAATSIGSGSTPTVTNVSTSFANDMIHAGTPCITGLTQTASGAGYTLIDTVTTGNRLSLASEFITVPQTQAATQIGFGVSCAASWGVMADAVEQAVAVVKSMTLPLLGVGN